MSSRTKKPTLERSSRAVNDPMARLANAVLLHAVEELQARNFLSSLDSLLFWLDPVEPWLWLEALEYKLTQSQLLPIVIKGAYNARKTRRYTARIPRKDE
jgi:hypothetical protein